MIKRWAAWAGPHKMVGIYRTKPTALAEAIKVRDKWVNDRKAKKTINHRPEREDTTTGAAILESTTSDEETFIITLMEIDWEE